jgi:hypothetical protein
MRPTGFSFPCLCPARREDEVFERFIKTAREEPSKIYNPYPQIARLENLSQARSNPLCNITYLSTITNPNSCLHKGLTCAHECIHLINNQSPAKMFARLLLCRAFDSLSALLSGFTWDSEMKKSWAEIVKTNSQLSDICTSITLSEELLTTALSFEFCGTHFSKELEVLREKEKKIVAKYTKLLPDFKELYFETFKKVVRWNFEDKGLLSVLEMFLQGIKVSRSPRAYPVLDGAKYGLLVVNSAKRCRILAERVNTMSSGNELYDWLFSTLEGTPEAAAFEAAWDTLYDLKDLSEERKYLWIFMQGSDDLDKFEDRFIPPNRVRVELEPLEFHREWHITYTYTSTNKSTEDEALVRILELESLLEQLSSGNGICCPHFDPWEGGCRCDCDPEWKEPLNRIARWAMEGKFDQGRFNCGNWKDLPPECRN